MPLDPQIARILDTFAPPGCRTTDKPSERAGSLTLKLRRAPGIMDRKALEPLMADMGMPERPTLAERLDHYRDEERYDAIDREREDCEKNEPEFLEADGPWGDPR